MEQEQNDDVAPLRGENLKKIIDEQYHGDYEYVSGLLGREVDTIKKYILKNGSRKISDKIGRDIERKLKLPYGYLDRNKNQDQQKDTYYIVLSVDDSETHDIIEWLYTNALEVKECSAILGQFDILLKIEVPSFHYLEMFFSRISQLPKVVRTQTFAAVDSLRWQREQAGHYSVKNPKISETFLDYYKCTRISNLMKEIHDIERGKIVASDGFSDRISLLEIMHWTKKSFFAVREYNEDIPDYDSYLDAEKSRISSGILSKRIFILPNDILNYTRDHDILKKTLNEASDIIKIGGDIKFIFQDSWIYRKDNTKPECFAIIDNSFVFVKKKMIDKSVLHGDREYIDIYQQLFNQNWDIGISYEKMMEKFSKVTDHF